MEGVPDSPLVISSHELRGNTVPGVTAGTGEEFKSIESKTCK